MLYEISVAVLDNDYKPTKLNSYRLRKEEFDTYLVKDNEALLRYLIKQIKEAVDK